MGRQTEIDEDVIGGSLVCPYSQLSHRRAESTSDHSEGLVEAKAQWLPPELCRGCGWPGIVFSYTWFLEQILCITMYYVGIYSVSTTFEEFEEVASGISFFAS